MKPTNELGLILATLLISQLTLCVAGGCSQAELAEWTYPSLGDMRRGQEDSFDQLLAQSNLTRNTVMDVAAIQTPEKAAEIMAAGSNRIAAGQVARDAAVANIPERLTGTRAGDFFGVSWWEGLMGLAIGWLGLDKVFGASRLVKSAAKAAAKNIAANTAAELAAKTVAPPK